MSNSTAHPIKILIIDDQKIGIELLENRLLTYPTEMEIVGTASTKRECLHLTKTLPKIDIILMDLIFNGETYDGVDLTKKILQESPDLKIILISQNYYLGDIFRAVKAGAKGLINKDISKEALRAEIIKVQEGKNSIDQYSLEQVYVFIKNIVDENLILKSTTKLTARECELVHTITQYKKFERAELSKIMKINSKDIVGQLVRSIASKWSIEGEGLAYKIYLKAITIPPHLW